MPCWPDGRPLAIGFDAFCRHGLRLFGLGKRLGGCREKLIKLVCLPLSSREDDLNRIPGHRVRRFYLERHGKTGRLHFMDGTPTIAEFELDRDEPSVLHWVGLSELQDGARQWMDLAAVDVDSAIPGRPRQLAMEAVS
ncbi:MAG: hypothetical protein L0Y71_14270 [Gemmataceae bacterium]|nr:hypothetical protein [Gemmataceae bacterium]